MVLAPYRTEVTERGRRRVVGALLTGAALLVVSWAAWLVDRSLLASDTRPAYYEFEAAFALADAWLALLLVAAARSLRARRATALLWLLAAGGAGGFLLAMDVLYNLQHGVWFASERGLVELAPEPGHRGRDGRPVRLDLAAPGPAAGRRLSTPWTAWRPRTGRSPGATTRPTGPSSASSSPTRPPACATWSA